MKMHEFHILPVTRKTQQAGKDAEEQIDIPFVGIDKPGPDMKPPTLILSCLKPSGEIAVKGNLRGKNLAMIGLGAQYYDVTWIRTTNETSWRKLLYKVVPASDEGYMVKTYGFGRRQLKEPAKQAISNYQESKTSMLPLEHDPENLGNSQKGEKDGEKKRKTTKKVIFQEDPEESTQQSTIVQTGLVNSEAQPKPSLLCEPILRCPEQDMLQAEAKECVSKRKGRRQEELENRDEFPQEKSREKRKANLELGEASTETVEKAEVGKKVKKKKRTEADQSFEAPDQPKAKKENTKEMDNELEIKVSENLPSLQVEKANHEKGTPDSLDSLKLPAQMSKKKKKSKKERQAEEEAFVSKQLSLALENLIMETKTNENGTKNNLTADTTQQKANEKAFKLISKSVAKEEERKKRLKDKLKICRDKLREKKQLEQRAQTLFAIESGVEVNLSEPLQNEDSIPQLNSICS